MSAVCLVSSSTGTVRSLHQRVVALPSVLPEKWHSSWSPRGLAPSCLSSRPGSAANSLCELGQAASFCHGLLINETEMLQLGRGEVGELNSLLFIKCLKPCLAYTACLLGELTVFTAEEHPRPAFNPLGAHLKKKQSEERKSIFIETVLCA